MTILPKLMYLFIAIPIKLPKHFFIELEKNYYKVHLEGQNIKNIKGNNEKNVKECGLAVPDLKLYYKAVVLKTIWYWLRDRREAEWNRIWVSDLSKTVYDKHKEPSCWDKTHYLIKKNCLENWKTLWEKLGLDQLLTPYTRINSEWVNELNVKKENINKLGKHRIVYLSDIWDGEDFITKQKLEKITKSKINHFDYIKLKKFLYKQNQ